MSIGSVAEFFLGNKQKAHQADVSSHSQPELETPQVTPHIFPSAQNPDIARVMRNKLAVKAQEVPKAA